MSARKARDSRMDELAVIALLQRIAVVANEATSLQDAIQVALDEVCAHTGWPVGHAYLPVDPDCQELKPSAIWHLDDPQHFATFRRVTEATNLRVGEGLPGRIAATGKPAWIVDVTADTNFPRTQLASGLGVRGAFGFPLLASRRVVGVLEFFSHTREFPDETLLELMGHVGTQLGRVVERETAAAALRAQVEHTQTLIESAYDAFVSIDEKGVIMGWNAAAETMFGWPRSEAIGRELAETIVPPEHRAAHRRGIARFLETGEGPILNRRLELTALHRDGREIPVELAVWPVESGGSRTFSAFIRDITERKQSEEAISRLAAIVESSEDAMIAKSIDGTILSWNRGAERLYGYSAQEAIGSPVSIIFPPERVDEIDVILDRLKRGESAVQHDTVRRAKSGRLVDVAVTISPIKDASGKIVAAASIARDVGERVRAEKRLRESEARLQTAQQISGIGSWEWEIGADHVTWSPQLYRTFDVTGHEFTPSFDGYLSLVHPDDRDHVKGIIEAALETHDHFQLVHRGLPKDGREPRIYLCTGEVLVQDGRPVRMAGTGEDITDRKRAEDALKRAFERERQTVSKLRELDQAKTIFISSVSHELRTPLTSIIGYLDLLRDFEAQGLTPNQQEMLAVVDRNSRRLLELIEDLLTFSRLQAGTFRPSVAPVDVAELFASARDAVLPQVSAQRLDIRFTVADGTSLLGDGAQLERVLLNLLSNAIKFTPGGGSIVVSAVDEGGVVRLSVSDTGIGISEEEIPRLFSPFYRSAKAEASAIPGTGLGLAIVKAIVEGHGGSIEIVPADGRGTVASVVIPAATAVRERAS